MTGRPGKAMSEAALAPATSQRGRQASARGRRNRLNALEALERGFALFKSTFAWEAWRYYSGAAPLVLCFIPMWVVNGQIRISDAVLLTEAALLTGAYLLRAWSVSNYMQRVRERAFGVPRPRPEDAAAQLAAMGRLLAWKIVLSAATLVALTTFAGAPWCYSACQFASLEAREDGSKRQTIGGCLALASQWFGGGLLLFLMLFPLWIAVWLNGLIVALLVPQLLQSRREGDDLRGLLASLPREQRKKAQMIASTAAGGRVAIGALVVLAAILAGTSPMARARAAQASLTRSSTGTPADTAREAQIQKLRRALDVESRRAIYRWHDAEHPSPPTWFDKLLDKIGHRIKRAWDAVQEFFRKLWPRGLNLGKDKDRPWQLQDLRIWLWLIVILTLAAAGVLLWLRRRRETQSLSLTQAIAPLPDLSEGTSASVRSEDEWFALAGRLEGEGELRFALRA